MNSTTTDQSELIEEKERQFYSALRRKQILLASLSLIALLLLGVIGIGIDWQVGTRLFSSANREIGPPPTDIPYIAYSIPSESGASVACWFAEAEDAQATVILVHSFRSSRVEMLDRSKFLFESGYSVLLIDLQAHGESINEGVTFGYLEKFDVQAAVADVKQKNPNGRIVILGSSLGATAALLAWPIDVDAMILESVCPSAHKGIINRFNARLNSFGKYLAPLVTWQFKPRVGVDMGEVSSIGKIRDVTCPILIISGQSDERATVQDAERMFRAAMEPKQMEVIPKATQADMYKLDPKMYENLVLDFLKTNDRNRFASRVTQD